MCDQGATNRATIRELSNDTSIKNSGVYFYVIHPKIFIIFEPPHLLKSTRNAFFKYIIRFSKSKYAKSEYVKMCFAIDKRRKYQSLRYMDIH